MNRVEVTGRLVRDPELRFVGDTRFPILTMNVGVEDAEGRWNRDTRKTEIGSGFYRVEIAGASAEVFAQQLSKGDEVYVVGSLAQFTTGGREGKEGETRTQIKAKLIQHLNPKNFPAAQAIQPPAQPEGWTDDEEPF